MKVRKKDAYSGLWRLGYFSDYTKLTKRDRLLWHRIYRRKYKREIERTAREQED